MGIEFVGSELRKEELCRWRLLYDIPLSRNVSKHDPRWQRTLGLVETRSLSTETTILRCPVCGRCGPVSAPPGFEGVESARSRLAQSPDIALRQLVENAGQRMLGRERWVDSWYMTWVHWRSWRVPRRRGECGYSTLGGDDIHVVQFYGRRQEKKSTVGGEWGGNGCAGQTVSAARY